MLTPWICRNIWTFCQPNNLGSDEPPVCQKSPGKITKNPGILTAGTQEWRFGSDDFPLANGWIFRWFQAVHVQGWSVILPCSQRGQRRSHHLNGGFGIFGTGFFRGGFGYRNTNVFFYQLGKAHIFLTQKPPSFLPLNTFNRCFKDLGAKKNIPPWN